MVASKGRQYTYICPYLQTRDHIRIKRRFVAMLTGAVDVVFNCASENLFVFNYRSNIHYRFLCLIHYERYAAKNEENNSLLTIQPIGM